MLLPGDLLVVGVGQDHSHLLVCQDRVVAGILVRPDADAFVAHCLPRPVERPIGEEDRATERIGATRPVAPVVVVACRELLAFVGCQQCVALAGVLDYREQPVLVGPNRGPGVPGARPVVAAPELHFSPGERLPGVGLQHEALGLRVVPPGANDQREVAHPEVRVVHLVVRFAKRRIKAGQQEVKPRLEVRRRGQLLDAFLVVRRGRELGRPLALRLPDQNLLAFITVQPFRTVAFARLHSRRPVYAHNAEVDLLEVAVPNLNSGPRCVPYSLRRGLRALGLDPLNEVVAHLAAEAVWKCPFALGRQLVRLDQLAFLLKHAGPLAPGAGRDLVVAVVLDEALQRCFVPVGLPFADSLVVAEVQPAEIGIEEGCLVAVAPVELHQILVQLHRLDRHRLTIGGLDLPLHELVGRGEDRAVGLEVEGVLRPRPSLLAGRVEAERFERHEVIQRGAVRVGHVALFQQRVVLSNGDLLQLSLGGQRRREVPVDLGKDARQIPREDIVARRLCRRRSLHEAPPVLLEEVPVPVG